MANETIEDIQALTNTFVDEQWDPTITVREWWARLTKAQLVNTTLPEEAGGRGWSTAQAAAANRVLTERRVVGPAAGLGMLLAAPTVAAYGSPEQIDKWVPAILDGTDSWCQLFSEPGAGSDLAGLGTRAVKDGDEWIITGQKVWTSNGHESDWGMLIARTDPELPKHQGITYFGFPMKQDGVEIRPLTEMTGRALFNEVFISEARVPDAYIIGGRGNGWRVANATLAYERAGIGGAHGGGFGTASPGETAGHLDQPVGDFLGKREATSVGAVGRRVLGLLSSEAAARGKGDDPVLRDRLAQLHILHRLASMTMKRHAAERRSGRKPTGLGAGVEGNLAKLHNTETLLLARDLAGEVLGPDAAIVGDDAATEGFLQELMLFSPAPPIYGGTDEVQRNVIGERGLGLPKEPGPSKETPFSELPKS
ncbi:MAG: acyl-CoA dehydrogenase family protein [Actinomycetota bacterium]